MYSASVTPQGSSQGAIGVLCWPGNRPQHELLALKHGHCFLQKKLGYIVQRRPEDEKLTSVDCASIRCAAPIVCAHFVLLLQQCCPFTAAFDAGINSFVLGIHELQNQRGMMQKLSDGDVGDQPTRRGRPHSSFAEIPAHLGQSPVTCDT